MWHKSSYSPSHAECVEVNEHQEGAEIRDTKHRDLTTLAFDKDQWAALVALVRK